MAYGKKAHSKGSKINVKKAGPRKEYRMTGKAPKGGGMKKAGRGK